MRLVRLYVNFDGIMDFSQVEQLVHTNAPDSVLTSVCKDIENDKILDRRTGLKGLIDVLIARGYKCDLVDNIPSFGFTENKG